MTVTANSIERQLRALGDKSIAEHSTRFFKTGDGEYGAGDQFLGIRMPVLRSTLKTQLPGLTLDCAVELLHSPWHETRMFAVLALLGLYKQRGASESSRKAIVTAYLKHRQFVNNWDLVDASAPGITGAWFFDRKRDRLDKMVAAKSMWDRRIAMLSTFFYIRKNDLDDTFNYAQRLLNDPQDLMHKAAGWMLREAGKRDEQRLCDFLDQHRQYMPRTMLRYSIERLPEKTRKHYMKK
jgi:3-methyladenine DNA glycosylase AlkD